MFVRSRLDGDSMYGELRPAMSRTGEPRLVLAVQRGDETWATIGPVAAAAGFELLESTPTERAVLKLMGYALPPFRAQSRGMNALLTVLQPNPHNARNSRRLHSTHRHETGMHGARGTVKATTSKQSVSTVKHRTSGSPSSRHGPAIPRRGRHVHTN